MRFLANTNFPFLRYKWIFIGVSGAFLAASLFNLFLGKGLVMGVDFAGGTQLTLRFRHEPDVARVRRALEALQLGEVTIQRFDEAGLNEILVRMQNPQAEGDFTKAMLDALEREFDVPTAAVHLNRDGAEAVRDTLAQGDPDGVGGSMEQRRAHYQPMAEALLALRKERGILRGAPDLEAVAELSPAVRRFFATDAVFGEFAMLAADNVGPLVGRDLRNKATMAGNLCQRTRCQYFMRTDTRCNKREPGSGCDALEGVNRNHAILGASEVALGSTSIDAIGRGSVPNALITDTPLVTVDGATVPLPLKEFELLATLMRNKGAVLTREALISHVWGYDFEGDVRTVDVHIRWLREKIEEDPARPRHLQTVRGVGYRMD